MLKIPWPSFDKGGPHGRWHENIQIMHNSSRIIRIITVATPTEELLNWATRCSFTAKWTGVFGRYGHSIQCPPLPPPPPPIKAVWWLDWQCCWRLSAAEAVMQDPDVIWRLWLHHVVIKWWWCGWYNCHENSNRGPWWGLWCHCVVT